MGEDVQAPLLLFGRNEPAGVQLGYNPVQAQLFLQLGQTIDQTCRGTERDLGLQDLVVSEIGEPFGLGLAALGGSGAGPSHRGPSELSLAIEIVPDALAGFLHGPRLRRPDVDGYAEIHIGFAGVTRLEPGLAVCPETYPQFGDIHNAQPDEDGITHLADLGEG